MPGGHHPRRTVEHRTEVIALAQLGLACRDAHPYRQFQCTLAAIAASTADLGEANAAHTPSPVCLNINPPCASIAARNTSSWAASATRIASGVGLPPTGRTLDVGEQKRHHPRRSSRRHGIASAHAICPSKPSDFAMSR